MEDSFWSVEWVQSNIFGHSPEGMAFKIQSFRLEIQVNEADARTVHTNYQCAPAFLRKRSEMIDNDHEYHEFDLRNSIGNDSNENWTACIICNNERSTTITLKNIPIYIKIVSDRLFMVFT